MAEATKVANETPQGQPGRAGQGQGLGQDHRLRAQQGRALPAEEGHVPGAQADGLAHRRRDHQDIYKATNFDPTKM
jgi:hypothetical protein